MGGHSPLEQEDGGGSAGDGLPTWEGCPSHHDLPDVQDPGGIGWALEGITAATMGKLASARRERGETPTTKAAPRGPGGSVESAATPSKVGKGHKKPSKSGKSSMVEETAIIPSAQEATAIIPAAQEPTAIIPAAQEATAIIPAGTERTTSTSHAGLERTASTSPTGPERTASTSPAGQERTTSGDRQAVCLYRSGGRSVKLAVFVGGFLHGHNSNFFTAGLLAVLTPL
ncbi:hypothetical protein NDU88_006260 [Pleurodeles waltl]|uniref:Uncharacterized protein n=1 Tax=Pleurodeles waltl TaxID=8319 RepID=A0AAV7PKC1_PLEWA|nr:hypothetical protein NDU88_006260 [Pleurodeles waltl]